MSTTTKSGPGTNTVAIDYAFQFDDGEVIRLEVRLDPQSLSLMSTASGDPPPWTRLPQLRCQVCRLDVATNSHCPVGVSLAQLVERFGHRNSYDNVEVTVTTAERVVMAATSLQAGLSALTGIYMVTAGCPTMNKLRPMVRFHLPFATTQETTYRATSMYLLAQFMRQRRELTADWSLAGLDAIYKEVHRVNVGIARGIREAAERDANANALVRLDLFTGEISFSIRDALSDLDYLFTPYLDE